jgi:hypothetical protein
MRLRFQGVVLRPIKTDPPRPVETICAFRRSNDNPILAIVKQQILPTFADR